MNPDDIRQMIEAGIEGAEAHVDGDGSHFVARVISDQFAGMPVIKQHKLVYATLGNSMESAIHALSIQTYTRDAWEKARKFQTL
ncbi:MAG: BolA/IbaG family iron-sulfur metabolism protein [Gammaproteobacteria bacterium]|nr:BolA/IbaG family iron-sulfur metabolism protein [Gammaproteobacteria bacterium]MCP5199411.1 BolA/IbaG family iron-sulfur metabolism protein [Gammaproteobacteria bacterium]